MCTIINFRPILQIDPPQFYWTIWSRYMQSFENVYVVPHSGRFKNRLLYEQKLLSVVWLAVL